MTATYTNKATGETYSIGFDLEENETALEAAWGRIFRVCVALKGWQHFDIKVAVN